MVVKITLSLVAVTIVAVSILVFAQKGRVNESSLENHFRMNKEMLSELQRTVGQLPWLSQVTHHSYSTRAAYIPMNEPELLDGQTGPIEAAQSYLSKLDLIFVRRSVSDHGEMLLFGTNVTDVDSGPSEILYEERGYAFTDELPTRLVNSIEEADVSDGPVYRQLEPNWYLYRKIDIRKPE